MVEKTLYCFPILEVGSYNLGSVLWFHMGIKNTVGLDNNIWALLAETVTPGEINFSITHFLPCHLSPERFKNGVTTTGDASRPSTNVNSATFPHIMPHPFC